MGIFNLSWFKSRKNRERFEALKIEEQVLKNEILRRKSIDERASVQKEKLYKNLKLVNDVLTVVLDSGNIITKSGATMNDFLNVKLATTEAEIINMLANKEEGKKDILDEIAPPTGDDFQTVCKFPDFEVAEECIYMNGIQRSLPPLLIKRFSEILNKYDRKEGWESKALNDIEYTSLKKFWLKCCLNPNARSAEDLYEFLSHHNMKIDRHGNFFAYRRVCSRSSVNKELIDVIGRAYNNVKAVWKKKSEDFRIEERNGEYSLHKLTSEIKGAIVGNLDELYRDLPNMTENSYTDQHTHRMDYRVGEIASIPRNECDDDNNINCSKGLHAASKAYDYTGFGDTPILMIINPMDVVATPLNDVGKLRVCRWFFATTLDEEDKYILDDNDFDVTELGDIFEEKCLANIEEHTHKSFTEEVVRHTFSIPQMSDHVISNIANTLRDMHNVIKSRVVIY